MCFEKFEFVHRINHILARESWTEDLAEPQRPWEFTRVGHSLVTKPPNVTLHLVGFLG